MGKVERVDLIRKIEDLRHTHVITYVTSTRVGFEVQMAMDAVPKVYEHLRLIQTPREETKIDLFIYSNGGDSTVPWRLVTLIREYASEFCVLVPFRAFSAATLVALGADKVLMHPMGTLGPTDPTIHTPLNPTDPANPNPNSKVGISVEDVSAYIALIKEDAGITHEDELVLAFNKLVDAVHPVVLGNVKRSISQSRVMASKLLALHRTSDDRHAIEEIVDKLTRKSYYHGHPINRREAREDIGLPHIEDASKELEHLMWQLYSDYEREAKMEEPFQPVFEYDPTNPQKSVNQEAKLAFIESRGRRDVFSVKYDIVGPPAPGQLPMGTPQPAGPIQVQVVHRRVGWVSEQG